LGELISGIGQHFGRCSESLFSQPECQASDASTHVEEVTLDPKGLLEAFDVQYIDQDIMISIAIPRCSSRKAKPDSHHHRGSSTTTGKAS
jgi:hypothetical protein